MSQTVEIALHIIRDAPAGIGWYTIMEWDENRLAYKPIGTLRGKENAYKSIAEMEEENEPHS